MRSLLFLGVVATLAYIFLVDRRSAHLLHLELSMVSHFASSIF